MSDPSAQHGFTLISALIAAVVFTMLALAAYSLSVASVKALRQYRDQTALASLADQYMELARNLPYSEVGTLSGNPHGVLPDAVNPATTTYNGTTYEIYFAVSNVIDPSVASSTNTVPDYKQIKVYVKNDSTGLVIPFTTTIVPQGIANAVPGGALSLKVFDASGNPVSGATLAITNSSVSPAVNVTRTTDANGNWSEVGLPSSVSGYHIVATKSGYSSDQSYPSSASNPNPTKPDATVVDGQVTQISFSIDKTSSLTVQAVDQLCQPVAGASVELKGSKLIGTSPDVLKFDSTYTTDSNGEVAVSPIEWDTYTPLVLTPSYMIYGSSPIQQIDLLPNTAQQSMLLLGPATNDSLLVIVKDAANNNPIEGATVELSSVSAGYDQSKQTEGSVLSQSDWSGGSGQSDFALTNEYASDDGNVDTQTQPTGVRLRQSTGSYVSSGTLTSSSFDTGTGQTAYTTLFWNPTSQSASTSVAFQIASNDDDATWNFVGPDGTANSYYTTPGTTINTGTTSTRYFRYKMYLASSDPAYTPVVSNVNINYVSGCAAPGQAMFAGLQPESDYQLVVSATGYQTQTITGAQVNGYTTEQVQMTQ